jgi:hypothetical protein
VKEYVLSSNKPLNEVLTDYAGNIPDLMDLMGVANKGEGTPSGNGKDIHFHVGLLSVDATTLLHTDDDDLREELFRDKLMWPAFYSGMIDETPVFNEAGEEVSSTQRTPLDLPLAVLTKGVIERTLGAYDHIGDMFKLNLEFPMAACYLGPIVYQTLAQKEVKTSTSSSFNTYVPVAVVFGNAKFDTRDAGDTQGTRGHFWTECKLPLNFGNSLIKRCDVVTVNVDGTATEERRVPEQHVWFHYDNLEDNGSPNWDLLVNNEKDPRLLPIYGGASEDSPPNPKDFRNYLPMGADVYSAYMIKQNMVSLGSIIDGSTTVKQNGAIGEGNGNSGLERKSDWTDYYRLNRMEMAGSVGGAWFVIFNNTVKNMPLIDSIMYARAKQ